MTFKEQCLKSMRNMYPDGVGTQQQHRDVILGYLAGWMDCLMTGGHKAALTAMLPEAQRLTDPNWRPDESWAWWASQAVELVTKVETPPPNIRSPWA